MVMHAMRDHSCNVSKSASSDWMDALVDGDELIDGDDDGNDDDGLEWHRSLPDRFNALMERHIKHTFPTLRIKLQAAFVIF